jgi:hypothetical protein
VTSTHFDGLALVVALTVNVPAAIGAV